MTEPAARLPEVAFYYPGHRWASSQWAKTMRLCVDGIAMPVPSHKQGDLEPEFAEIALPLIEQGLLHMVVPELRARSGEGSTRGRSTCSWRRTRRRRSRG